MAQPSIDTAPDPESGLEHHPQLLRRLQKAWPSQQALRDIDQALSEGEGPDAPRFDLEALRELLLLHAIAREAPPAHFSDTPAAVATMAVGPVPAADGDPAADLSSPGGSPAAAQSLAASRSDDMELDFSRLDDPLDEPGPRVAPSADRSEPGLPPLDEALAPPGGESEAVTLQAPAMDVVAPQGLSLEPLVLLENPPAEAPAPAPEPVGLDVPLEFDLAPLPEAAPVAPPAASVPTPDDLARGLDFDPTRTNLVPVVASTPPAPAPAAPADDLGLGLDFPLDFSTPPAGKTPERTS